MTWIRRRLPARADQGFGLPELIVTMFLFSLIMTLVLGLVVTFSQTFTRERSATDSTNVAAIGMNELTRVIRSGTEIRVSGSGTNLPVFVEARADSVVLYAFLDTDSLNPKPVKVRFSIDANRQLIEERWDADAASGPYWTFGPAGSAADSRRPIARQIPVLPAGSPPLFTYRSADVCTLANPNCNVLAPPAGGQLTEAQRKLVAMVEISLTVQADITARAEPVTLQNQVGLPNLGVDRVGATL